VLTNLLDNALKYSAAGTAVYVTGRPEANGAVISVEKEDGSIPIDRHDQIFDRFYQVDQSSTRTVGGAGLRPLYLPPARRGHRGSRVARAVR
jgi:signal transduction histidine kinase